MYIVFLNFLCFSPFYSLKEKQKIKSYDIKNCYLLSPIMKIEIIKPTQSKSKSSLVLPNTINQSFYVTMYYNVLKKRIGIKNWDQFSAQVLSPYIKQSNIAFFDEKRYFDPWQYRGKYPRLSRGRPGFKSRPGHQWNSLENTCSLPSFHQKKRYLTVLYMETEVVLKTDLNSLFQFFSVHCST